MNADVSSARRRREPDAGARLALVPRVGVASLVAPVLAAADRRRHHDPLPDCLAASRGHSEGRIDRAQLLHIFSSLLCYLLLSFIVSHSISNTSEYPTLSSRLYSPSISFRASLLGVFL